MGHLSDSSPDSESYRNSDFQCPVGGPGCDFFFGGSGAIAGVPW